jgi:ketosteroid isomerase-like protein
MPEENLEIVRRLYAVVSASGQTPRELLAPDYEVDNSDVAGGTVGGYDASEHVLREYWNTFDDFRVELTDVLHSDDERVVTRIRDGGRVKGSDAEVNNIYFHVWTFRGGKVARLSIHSDRARAVEVAGLSD